ncbi:carbamoyl-phosphate synthase large subunit [Candidatus Micrarchaeota archaeon CG10_big_fil_rev_8_21_14_0_10_45_29]|nr:MAG: carbamoyl-phosphate synthase large subunit [Candidatus Micrarchaeota archaeon CG10_big_fil_rev_8_21_14_0_10_45_29]
MPKLQKIKKVLVIGSGPIVIGQSAEFDYSGSQACKALKEEGIHVVLLNSNPATIQTDTSMADTIYIEPLLEDVLEKIIIKEKPDGIIATMGGQTALNLAMQLHRKGALKKHNAALLGTEVNSIKLAEDRGDFANLLKKIGEPLLDSVAANTKEEAFEFAKKHKFPLILRPAFTLGGTGGGMAYDEKEFEKLLKLGFTLSPTHQVLIEESVLGWGEFEYEMMRDAHDNCITICNMENIDPMGVHTGESVVVAPSQTLSDGEHQMLRSAAIKIIRALDIIGGCNIQFALNQKTGKYVVVEVNPRLSRSSALASKATGYPIARVAAKLAIGYSLNEVKNAVTKTTPASFEPALDYVVTKIPRWPFDKMPQSERRLGTQMKSTGEVMAIGRTFEQSFQKALSSLDQKLPDMSKADLKFHLSKPTDWRVFAILQSLKNGATAGEIVEQTSIHPWFIHRLEAIVKMEEILRASLDERILREAKRMGFSDSQIGKLAKKSEDEVRKMRKTHNILPVFKMVDTCAGEFEAKTPYYYSTYEDENESICKDEKKVIVLGSGPIRIGQGIEFDYCCCHASFALKKKGIQSILINNNPETISTDFDTSDKLYFEPLDFENVMNIVEHEKPMGVIVQFGGQTSINLASRLAENGVNILGTSVDAIDLSEDRERFRQILKKMNLRQPENATATNLQQALAAAKKITYPVVVRPSYVIAGRGMQIVYDDEGLTSYMDEAVEVSNKKPVLIDKYIDKAIECEIDGICDGEDTWIAGIMEHIERAGVHSGDASCTVPPYRLKAEVQEKILSSSREMAKEIGIVGAVNIQYVVKNDELYVLELNPRGSRTMPYLSKATGIPIVQMATNVLLGDKLSQMKISEPQLSYYAVKSVVFPFLKLPGVDFILGPEMKSTGESMGIDSSFPLAYYKSLLGANLNIPTSGIIAFSLKKGDQERALPLAQKLEKMGFEIAATPGTASFLDGSKIIHLNKISSGEPNLESELKNGKIKMVINTPSKGGRSHTDGFAIRRAALEANVPCITNFEAAEALIDAMEVAKENNLEPKSLQEYWGK